MVDARHPPEEWQVILERRCEAWKALAQGRGLLLAAYRTGGRPPEKAFKLIDEARKVLGDEEAP